MIIIHEVVFLLNRVCVTFLELIAQIRRIVTLIENIKAGRH